MKCRGPTLKLNATCKRHCPPIPVFIFPCGYPYNPYLSRRPLTISKTLAVEVSPVYEIDCKEIKGLTFPLTGANYEFISL